MNLPLRALALVFIVATSVALAAELPATPPPPMGSKVFDWTKLVARPTGNGMRRDVANNPTTTLATFESHITTLSPGAFSHLPHRHPQEEIIIIKEGTVDVSLNGEVQRTAGPGATLFFASNDAHAVHNVGEGPATYFVLNFATEATRKTPLPTPAFEGPPTLRSSVFFWEKLTARPAKTGEYRAIVNSPTITLGLLDIHGTILNPGEEPHAPHRHPYEELVAIREGTLDVTINGETQRVGPGSILFFASNDLHGWRNVGNTPATYHVLRVETPATPKPAATSAK